MRFLVVGVITLGIVGCGESVVTYQKPGTVLNITEERFLGGRDVLKYEVADFANVSTVGSHSYIPLMLRGDPHERHQIILHVLEQFETAHPEWEIVQWKIEKQQSAHSTSEMIFGIWVDHRLRSELAESPDGK